jgi:hypothetical protein
VAKRHLEALPNRPMISLRHIFRNSALEAYRRSIKACKSGAAARISPALALRFCVAVLRHWGTKNRRACVSASVTLLEKEWPGILAWAWALSSIGAGDRVIIYQIE